jgi:hypothetical protein
MSKADTLLKKAIAFERLALYSDRKTFLKSLAQPMSPEYKQFYNLDEFGNPKQEGIPPVPPVESVKPSTNSPTMNMPTDKITAFPSIDPKEQENVFRIATVEGLIVPPDSKHMSDGKLGPQTQAAIKALRSATNRTNGQPLFPELQAIKSDKDVLTWAGLKVQSPRYGG